MGLALSRHYDAERQIATGFRTGWVALATFLGLIALSVALFAAFEHAIVVADDLSRDDERKLVQRFVFSEAKAVEIVHRIVLSHIIQARDEQFERLKKVKYTVLVGFEITRTTVWVLRIRTEYGKHHSSVHFRR